MRFTPEQLSAIEANNKELLVSAAAGSGKTAVLVERILRMIVKRGLSLDRVLVVTFTRAAASELRERLELRLAEAAESDMSLTRQLELIPDAQISTIHGYCTQVLRTHFQHCELDPLFTICDAATRERLFSQSLESALDQLYTLCKQDDDLRALTAKFAERELVAMLPPLYDFLMSRPKPFEWFEALASKEWSVETVDETPMAQALMREASVALVGARELHIEALNMSREPGFPQALLATLDNDDRTLSGLEEACNDGLSPFIGALSRLRFATIARVKPDSDDEAAYVEDFKDYRERYKGLINGLKKLLPEDISSGVGDLNAMSGATRGLYKLAKLFHEEFQAAKKSAAQVDFNDLEHMTLDVLSDERLRGIERERFDAVFVDEYQDVSAIQEAVLNGLKREGDATQSFFYVGDVKQSIYRFRLAEPKLFLQKQRDFSIYEDAPQRLIVLNRNFRSREAVLSAVNRVFEHVMDSRVTEIDYDESAHLYPGVPSVDDPQTELHFLDSEGHKPQERVLAEATAIARDILARIGEPITDAEGKPDGVLHYRDIAVLMPVSKNIADKVELTLRSFGIPVYCENASDSMQSDEITQVLQHLRLMDNLMDDISLISELRGPLFELTESELCQVRLQMPQKEASFLDALAHASESAQDDRLRARCADALHMLEHERFLLNGMALDEYLWDFLQRSGMYAHYGAQPGGKLRQANLQMLCNLASEYEQNRGDGLSGFLDSLGADLKIASGLSPTVVNPWEDVVRLMTIHKSKGLEFPTVYVMGLGGALRRRSQSGRISYHAELGIALGYVNEKARTKRKTLLQTAIELMKRSEERAERARLLYVAMTRAKRRLVLLGTASSKDICYEDALALQKNSFTGGGLYTVASASSMLDWLVQSVRPWDDLEARDFSTNPIRIIREKTDFSTLSTGFPHKEAIWQVVFHIKPDAARVSQKRGKVKLELPLLPQKVQEKYTPVNDWTMAQDDPVAPRLDIRHQPLKLGVTTLCKMLGEGHKHTFPTLPDAAWEGDPDRYDEPETPDTKRLPLLPELPRLLGALAQAPAFLQAAPDERPLRRGTATHKLLCMIDLNGAREQSERTMRAYVDAERQRLSAQGVLSAEEALDADASLVAGFLSSDMGRRMLASPTVRREWRFNLRVREPMDVLAQGVIDLCFLEDGGWVLVDFKTDRVTDERALLERYERQLGMYRQALESATPYPVRESALYSLTLGRAVHADM